MYIIIKTNDSGDPQAYGTFITEAKAEKKLAELRSKMTEYDWNCDTQFNITKLNN